MLRSGDGTMAAIEADTLYLVLLVVIFLIVRGVKHLVKRVKNKRKGN